MMNVLGSVFIILGNFANIYSNGDVGILCKDE